MYLEEHGTLRWDRKLWLKSFEYLIESRRGKKDKVIWRVLKSGNALKQENSKSQQTQHSFSKIIRLLIASFDFSAINNITPAFFTKAIRRHWLLKIDTRFPRFDWLVQHCYRALKMERKRYSCLPLMVFCHFIDSTTQGDEKMIWQFFPSPL